MASSNHRTRGFVRSRPLVRPKRIPQAVTLVELQDLTWLAELYAKDGTLKGSLGMFRLEVDRRKRAESYRLTVKASHPDDTLRAIVRQLNLELRRGLALAQCAGYLALADWAQEHGAQPEMLDNFLRIGRTYAASRGQPKRRPAPRPRPQ
jgi:hypothetical protein